VAVLETHDNTTMRELTAAWPWLAILLTIGAVLFTLAAALAVRLGHTVTRISLFGFPLLMLLPPLITPWGMFGLLHAPMAAGYLAGIYVFAAFAKKPIGDTTQLAMDPEPR
jgi:hypothetical protein